MKTTLAIALLSVPLAAAAQSTPPSSDAVPNAVATTAATATVNAPVQTHDDRDVDRLCLRETGTRIRPNRATAGARCPNAQPGRVYTQEDLRNTGRVDVADMLRTLDPSIR